MKYGDDCAAISGMNEWQGKPKYSEKICPGAALSTTDPHRPPHDLTRAAAAVSASVRWNVRNKMDLHRSYVVIELFYRLGSS
jgi:hypothetical protein